MMEIIVSCSRICTVFVYLYKISSDIPILHSPDMCPTSCLNLPPQRFPTSLYRTEELLYGMKPQGQPCLDTLPVRKASRCPLHTITLVDTMQWLSGSLSESDILLAGKSKGSLSEQTD